MEDGYFKKRGYTIEFLEKVVMSDSKIRSFVDGGAAEQMLAEIYFINNPRIQDLGKPEVVPQQNNKNTHVIFNESEPNRDRDIVIDKKNEQRTGILRADIRESGFEAFYEPILPIK